MSKSNPSEVKLAVPTSGGFSGLKSLNLQVFVMIAAIIAIMLFFTWTTDGAYLSARNVSNLLRQTAITGILYFLHHCVQHFELVRVYLYFFCHYGFVLYH